MRITDIIAGSLCTKILLRACNLSSLAFGDKLVWEFIKFKKRNISFCLISE